MKLPELMGYEFKKMFRRKSCMICTLVILPILLTAGLLMIMGNMDVDGEFVCTRYEYAKMERKIGESMNGMTITEERLLEAKREWQEYSQLKITADNYLEIREKYMEARLLIDIASDEYVSANLKEGAGFYELWQNKLKTSWETLELSDTQIAYLTEKMEGQEEPWAYAYNAAYERFTALQMTIILFVCIIMVICLAPMFGEEYSSRVDALMLSSKYGRSKVFLAKILTGLVFAFSVTVLGFLAVWIEQGIIYGFGDASAPMQVIYQMRQYEYPYPFTSGGVLFLMIAGGTIGILFFAAMIMVFSACMKTAFGPAVAGLMLCFLPMFDGLIPIGTWPLLDMISRFVPGIFASFRRLLEVSVLQAGNWCFQTYQYMPVVYLLLAGIFLLFSARRFLNHRPL